MVLSYVELKQEAEDSGIHIISAQYDDKHPGNVPEDHREKFRCVQLLGDRKFDEYASQPSMNPTAGPWQRERKQTATYIFNRAVRCRQEKRNEEGWRESVEHCIFNRFYIEVTW
jgi:hypothetical protein